MSSHLQAITQKVRIHGTVQGVGFRAWVQHHAEELGLSGWVRNRTDGTVEAEFHGPLEDVKRLTEECHHGPLNAEVSKVDPEPVEGNPARGFEIKVTV